MMITGATPNCYPNGQQIYEDVIPSSHESNSSAATHPASFLYNLSLLKDKVHQVQSLATIFLSHDHGHPPLPESTAVAAPTMTTLIQEIIMTASSMMFACQQMSLASPHAANNNTPTVDFSSVRAVEERGPSASASAFFSDQWYCDNYNNAKSTDDHNNSVESNSRVKELALPKKKETNDVSEGLISSKNFDIIELDAADLLAKYTHYCQVCGKGFKRDANLRMHMRAHGDEYKSSAALTNPMKGNSDTAGGNTSDGILRKYSCPQEGCRWNKNHAKFQPLKSMICVKNHYKRSHCPKMYVCKRCNRKQFSVLSDLRTHEKHCGDLKWQCSCGTTFSRKDKLMGHVALFVGHTPAVGSLTKTGNGAHNSSQMQVDQSR